jgi:hypothetical protein
VTVRKNSKKAAKSGLAAGSKKGPNRTVGPYFTGNVETAVLRRFKLLQHHCNC